MNLNVVLIEPEIPQNTGNISRTCAACGVRLHLVKPIGFSLSDRYLKRAGVDYWDHLDLRIHESEEEFFRYLSETCAGFSTGRPDGYYFLSKKAENIYTDVEFPSDSYLIFGKESVGLPESLLSAHRDSCLRIPMAEEIRSLNLSNAVAVLVYEALRQHGFPGLRKSYSETSRGREQ